LFHSKSLLLQRSLDALHAVRTHATTLSGSGKMDVTRASSKVTTTRLLLRLLLMLHWQLGGNSPNSSKVLSNVWRPVSKSCV
jgi:hypothetical protein